MKKETAISIPLKEWQDPVNDVILHFSERECSIYFLCWDENHKINRDIIGKLYFEAWAVHSVRSEVCPHIKDFKRGSSILEVINSVWMTQVNKYFYNNTDLSKTSHHYIVKGHDIFYEIIADKYEEIYIRDSEEFRTLQKEFEL